MYVDALEIGRGSRSVPLTTSVCRRRRSSHVWDVGGMSVGVKVGGGFNGDVDVELVVLIICYKTCCQRLGPFPLRLS